MTIHVPPTTLPEAMQFLEQWALEKVGYGIPAEMIEPGATKLLAGKLIILENNLHKPPVPPSLE